MTEGTSASALLGRAVSVRVPATAANLGPGFDTLGLALSIYDELEVQVVAAEAVHPPVDGVAASVTVHGVGEGEVPTDGSNIVIASMARVLRDSLSDLDQIGFQVEARNAIPHGRGLGSSGAAIVSGIVAAAGLLSGITEFSEQQLLAYATELEGHPDNVAPALFGGLTIAWLGVDGPQSKKLQVHRGVSPLVLVPQERKSTNALRSLQPTEVPAKDAIFNVSRSALLVAALLQSPELLLDATEDRLHQNYRASAMPATSELVAALRAAGFPAVVSGAGPSVLVLASDPGQRVQAAELVATHSPDWQAHMLAIDLKGATVVAHPVSG